MAIRLWAWLLFGGQLRCWGHTLRSCSCIFHDVRAAESRTWQEVSAGVASCGRGEKKWWQKEHFFFFFDWFLLGKAGGGCRCHDSSASLTLNLSSAAWHRVHFRKNCSTVHQTEREREKEHKKIEFLAGKVAQTFCGVDCRAGGAIADRRQLWDFTLFALWWGLKPFGRRFKKKNKKNKQITSAMWAFYFRNTTL